jgi:hypothetical protein
VLLAQFTDPVANWRPTCHVLEVDPVKRDLDEVLGELAEHETREHGIEKDIAIVPEKIEAE